MIDMLQAEENEPLEQETVEDVNLDSVDPSQGADEAPAEKKKVEFTPEQQEVFNNAINEKTRETHNIRREKEASDARVAELQAKIPQEQRPNIPPIPESYEENLEELHRIRDQAIADQANFDGRQAFAQEQQQSAAQTQQNETRQKLQSAAVEYKGAGQKFGFSDSDMQNAANTLRDGGLSEDIQYHILFDKSGPLITDFLSKNPIELGNLRTMEPLAQAAYIEGTIKPKASKTRKPTQAPEPADILSGGGSSVQKLGPKGAKFT